MQEKSNARFLGQIISDPLKIVGYYNLEEPTTEPIDEDGDAPEPDPDELPDMDWAAQKTEYEL